MKLIQVVLVMLLFSVSSHLMSLDIGDKAPGFTLEATDGKTYSLDQFLNKEAVVIAWYPSFYQWMHNRMQITSPKWTLIKRFRGCLFYGEC